MHLNSALNLVLPVTYAEQYELDPDDETKKVLRLEPVIRAYHQTLPREIFETNHRLLTRTYTLLWENGFRGAQAAAASGSAALTLKDVAKRDAEEWGLERSPGPAFLAEIARLTTVIVPEKTSYETLPVEIAIAQNIISGEDWAEVESAIVFFIASLWGTPRATRERLAQNFASAVRSLITSSPLTEYVASLKTSTSAETSELVTASSVPS